MGVYNTGNLANVQASQVSQVWMHSNYNQTYLKNDIALLRLATPMYINANVQPICLPQAGQSYVGAPRYVQFYKLIIGVLSSVEKPGKSNVLKKIFYYKNKINQNKYCYLLL